MRGNNGRARSSQSRVLIVSSKGRVATVTIKPMMEVYISFASKVSTVPGSTSMRNSGGGVDIIGGVPLLLS